MIPKLYAPDGAALLSWLGDTTEVTEERNGIYELYMEIPTASDQYPLIENDCLAVILYGDIVCGRRDQLKYCFYSNCLRGHREFIIHNSYAAADNLPLFEAVTAVWRGRQGDFSSCRCRCGISAGSTIAYALLVYNQLVRIVIILCGCISG